MAKKVVLNPLKIQSGTTNVLFCDMKKKWDVVGTKAFEYRWYYMTSDKKWCDGTKGSGQERNWTYTIPANAKKVKFQVLAVSDTHKVDKADVKYFEAEWSKFVSFDVTTLKPEVPPTPTLTMHYRDKDIIATCDVGPQTPGVTNATTHIEFDFYLDKETIATSSSSSPTAGLHLNQIMNIGKAAVNKIGIASYKVKMGSDVPFGNAVKVRCRAYDNEGDTSAWTDYCEYQYTTPEMPVNGLVSVETSAGDSITVNVTRGKAHHNDSYEIQYTTDPKYFDTSQEKVTTVTQAVENGTKVIITGLASGHRYYVRYRVTSGYCDEKSAWSGIKSALLAKTPEAPTTWSLKDNVSLGGSVDLFWTHNPRDESKESYAQIQYSIGGTSHTETIKNDKPDDEKETSNHYTLSTADFSSGGDLTWSVRTCGVIISGGNTPIDSDYGPWSTVRTIRVSQEPNLILSTNLEPYLGYGDAKSYMATYPLTINMNSNTTGQHPLSYNLQIVSEWDYNTTDNTGESANVGMGEVIYSKNFDTTDTEVNVTLEPGDVNLANNGTYKIRATVFSSNSLSTTKEIVFLTLFEEDSIVPDAAIGADFDKLTAYITPNAIEYLECVSYEFGKYDLDTGETVDDSWSVRTTHEQTTRPTQPVFIRYNDGSLFDKVGIQNGEGILENHDLYYSSRDELTLTPTVKNKSYIEYTLKDFPTHTDLILSGIIYRTSVTEISKFEVRVMSKEDESFSYYEIIFDDASQNSFELNLRWLTSNHRSIRIYPIGIPDDELGTAHFKFWNMRLDTETKKYNSKIEVGALYYDENMNIIGSETGTEFLVANLPETCNYYNFYVRRILDARIIDKNLIEYKHKGYDVNLVPTPDDETLTTDRTDDVIFSVYRLEEDGEFTEIASDMDGALNLTTMDPHPQLRVAKYRIVAKSKKTGETFYEDLGGYAIGETSIVINWDERVKNKFVGTEDEYSDEIQNGNILKLKYNIDITDTTSPEVALVKYAGRHNAVSYYGTQREHSATWNTVIPITDTDTIDALRRLAIYPGDCYVREPSGNSYWATIKVSFPINHLATTVPVTLSLTKVEGGA